MGDEFHVLVECKNPTIVEKRKLFLPTYYLKHPSMFKCVSLLQTSDKKLLQKLGAFLGNVLTLFK